jgi:MATE family multidrug resistance protein
MPDLAGLRMLRSAFAGSWPAMAGLLRLGLPIGGMIGIELGVFLAAGIAIGLLGAAALGAHQLMLNSASLTFMVPLGLSQAATVRAAYELGAGRAPRARQAGFVALALGIGFMSTTAVVLWTVPEAVIAVYLDIADPANRETIEIARHLIAIAALSRCSTGCRRSLPAPCAATRTRLSDVIGDRRLLGRRFAGGWMLAFPLGYGAVGLWWALPLASRSSPRC